MTQKSLGRPIDPDARAARRQQIMDGARNCFAQKGFHASSMSMISAEAGVSIANIYQYFETKDDLILALVGEELKSDMAVIDMIGQAPSLREGLEQVVQYLAGEGCSEGGVQLRLEVLAESFRNPVVAEEVRKNEVIMIEALAKTLSTAKKTGEIARHVVPEDAALLILAFADGLSSRLPIKIRPLSGLATPAFTFIAMSLGLEGF